MEPWCSTPGDAPSANDRRAYVTRGQVTRTDADASLSLTTPSARALRIGAYYDGKMPISPKYHAAPRILSLGDAFYDEVMPAEFPLHRLRFRHHAWAARIGLDDLDAHEWTAHFARFLPLPDNLPKPLALRYHGHQFDVYNPQLGDGRGFLFAQLLEESNDASPPRLLDLGTKGTGRTPWSRGADGRLTLKGGVREVLATEMLEALGVNTSKTLSLFETGESLMRGDEPSPTRSSVLVRLNHSHLRFGTFQRLSHLGETEALSRLLAYAIENYFPELKAIPSEPQRAEAFLVEVCRRTALLVSGWMAAGFVHGVLNSDNMTITGESFDYGPYRFLPTYDVHFTAAYFDHQGLYCYGRQPAAVFRNLVRLSETLRPLAPDLAVKQVLGQFEAIMEKDLVRRILRRLGLASNGDMDSELIVRAYTFLETGTIGYEQFFFDLYGGKRPSASYAGATWESLREILDLYQPARAKRPAYFDGPGPCTLLIDEIEAIWDAIAKRDDWAPFCEKISSIRAMGAAVSLA